MRKEQTLLLICAGLGALLVWSATGKYQEVGAATIGYSPTPSVEIVTSETPDPLKGLKHDPLKGRALSARVRLEKRPPLPELAIPSAIAPIWVVPPAEPGPSPDHWRPLRTTIVPAKAPEKDDKEKEQDQANQPDANPSDTAAEQPPIDVTTFGKPKTKFDPDKAAHLVRPTGEKNLIEIEIKNHKDWDILANWPNLEFTGWQLNKDGTRFGKLVYSPSDLAGYQTLHLKKTLENEYHEERIRRGFKDTDREALISFAKWVFEDLAQRKGVDEVTYGIAAVKLAIEELKKAQAIGNDLSLTRLLGAYYRAAYDIENELKTYSDYLAGHPNDTAALVLVGDTYDRIGALDASRALFEKAAQTGDPESRLRLGIIASRQGRLDAAMDILKPISGISGVGARALVEMAWIAVAQGRPEEAAGYVAQAKKDIGATPALNLAQGSILYGQKKFTEAAQTFAAAKDEKRSTWQSDHGLALIGAGDLEGAQKDFAACLEQDPLNLVDPLFGMGHALQYRADTVQRSNDAFELARQRSPNDPWILLRVGTIRLRDGINAEALALARRLLDVAPGRTEGLWLVGRAAEAVARGDDSMKKTAAQSLLDIESKAKVPDADEVAILKDLVAEATPESRRTEHFFAMAIAHLKRAVDKEPDNRDFIHEHSRVLVLGGRVEEAVKVLETATDVKSGVGRGDPRLFTLLSWARFLAKRPAADAQEAIQRGMRAQPDEESRKWLESAQKSIQEWDKTRVWEDTFNRESGSEVRNGWKENDKQLGIAITLDDGRALFKTERVRESAPDRELSTRLFRDDMELNRVKIVQASFKACPGVESIFHIYSGALASRTAAGPAGGGGGRRGGAGGELGIGCDRNGNMVLWAPPPGSKGGVGEILVKDASGANRQWPMDDFHKVKIIRKDDAKGIFEIWLDDERITLGTPEKPQPTFEALGLSSTVGKNFGLGFLVDADQGAQVDVEVESVQVTKTNK